MFNQGNFPATLNTDLYKLMHRHQYRKGTNTIYSTFTLRANKYIPQAEKAVIFGIQYAVNYVHDLFNDDFFGVEKEIIVGKHKEVVETQLGVKVDTSHIEALHELGYLPIEIKAIEEGTRVEMGNAFLTIVNTHKDFYWLTNYLETIISNLLWYPTTIATITNTMRDTINKYKMITDGNLVGAEFLLHDFGMRGLSSPFSAAIAAMSHATAVVGEETIPSLAPLEKYYNLDITKEMAITGIPATEHSVMCSLTPVVEEGDIDFVLKDGESVRALIEREEVPIGSFIKDPVFNLVYIKSEGEQCDLIQVNGEPHERAAYHHLLTEVHPNGPLSVVSDTYNFWKVITETIPSLEKEIVGRQGFLSIRPDSGDPVEILCGKEVPEGVVPQTPEERAMYKGVIETLWETFGDSRQVTDNGYGILDSHIRVIYGDSITVERAEEIYKRLEAKKLSISNVVLAVGSYQYQGRPTRDSMSMAMKATHSVVGEKEIKLFKDPKTDPGKRSQRGVVCVVREGNKFITKDNLTFKEYNEDSLESVDFLKTVYKDGKVITNVTFNEIRERIHGDKFSVTE